MSKNFKKHTWIALVAAAAVLLTGAGFHKTALAKEPDKNGFISAEDAKAIVLGKIPGAIMHDFELDKEHGRAIYEGEAILGEYEYEFEIDAASGEILQWEKEPVIYDDGDDLYDGDDGDGDDDPDDDEDDTDDDEDD